MLSNFIIFRIYLCIAIIMLLPVCYFLSIELLDHMTFYSIMLQKFRVRKKHVVSLNEITFIVNYFFKREQWLHCITFFQFTKSVDKRSIHLLGQCYYNLSYLFIARYYYIQALQFDNSIKLLQSLALVCRDLKDEKMMIDTCNKISKIDPENSVVALLI